MTSQELEQQKMQLLEMLSLGEPPDVVASFILDSNLDTRSIIKTAIAFLYVRVDFFRKRESQAWLIIN